MLTSVYNNANPDDNMYTVIGIAQHICIFFFFGVQGQIQRFIYTTISETNF